MKDASMNPSIIKNEKINYEQQDQSKLEDDILLQSSSVLFQSLSETLELPIGSAGIKSSQHAAVTLSQDLSPSVWQTMINQTVSHLRGYNGQQLEVFMNLPKLGLLTLDAKYQTAGGWQLTIAAKKASTTHALRKAKQMLTDKICDALDDRVSLSIEGNQKNESIA